MTGPEHLAKAQRYIRGFDDYPDGTADLTAVLSLALLVGAAIAHAAIAHTLVRADGASAEMSTAAEDAWIRVGALL